MSSRRFRSGGMSMRITDRRRKRSSRTRPSCTAVSKPGSTPAIGRTSKLDRLAGLDEQRLAIAQQARQPRLHARRRFGDVLQIERAAARLVQAALAADALEALRLSAAAAAVGDARPRAEQLDVELVAVARGAVDRDERAAWRRRCSVWIARAATWRPVPSSPRIITPARIAAARAISAITSRIAGEWP